MIEQPAVAVFRCLEFPVLDRERLGVHLQLRHLFLELSDDDGVVLLEELLVVHLHLLKARLAA